MLIRAGQGIFFYKNHPIRFVTIAGLIVARGDAKRGTVLTIDDSSGATVDLVVPHSTDPKHLEAAQETQPLSGDSQDAESKEPTPGFVHVSMTDKTILDVSDLVSGAMVKVKATLDIWWGVPELKMERFTVLRDTNAEMEFLEERLRALLGLSVPWVLSEEEVEELRREGEEGNVRAREEREKNERRLKRRIEREERDAKKILKMYRDEEAQMEKEAGVCRDKGVAIMRAIEERKRWG